MNTLYYLRFNNYYNRIVKKYDTIQDYIDNSETSVVRTRINFIPGDGVTTTQVINWSLTDDSHPDYLLVADESGTTLLSRWFILESKRTSGGQYKQTLKRDVIADNYNDIITAPMFIEKATVNQYDSAIYNKENITFNEIKRDEILIKDNSDCAWLVGYVARNYNQACEFDITTYYDEEYSSLQAYPYYSYFNKNAIATNSGKNLSYVFYIKVNDPNSNTPTQKVTIYSNKVVEVKITNDTPTNYISLSPQELASYLATIREKVATTNYPDLTSEYNPTNTDKVTSNILANLSSQDGKIIKAGNSYYRINAEKTSNKSQYAYTTPGSNASVYGCTITNETITNNFYSYGVNEDIVIKFSYTQFNQLKTSKGKIDFSQTRTHCADSPYDIFCMPYKDGMRFVNDNLTITSSKTNNMAIASGLNSLTGVVYDMQLLPYCPLIDTFKNQYTLTDYGTTDYQYVTDNATTPNKLGVIMWCSRSSFTKLISCEILVDDIKLSNETEKYRLCSPNYNGVFEFSPAKNMLPGSPVGVRSFKIDCAYKPYTPYIHLAPNFQNLYGGDFNDARGLICGGDFSITALTDQWSNYQINNKNYQNSFDRQIESLELQNKWSRVSDISSIATTTVSTGVMGAIMGKTGGALLGGGAGLADSTINIVANEQMRRDTLDMTKDQFGFELGNIKALPNTINKVSSFNQNNKLFPFVEVYGPTEVEIEAFKNKLKYNGMTVGRIGTIQEFQLEDKSYIKGKLIRLEGDVDYHLTIAIAEELNQGVFI